ncbi:putative leader peptide [Streptomyces sp. NPDC023723]
MAYFDLPATCPAFSAPPLSSRRHIDLLRVSSAGCPAGRLADPL